MSTPSKRGASLPILLGVGAVYLLAEYAGLAAASLNPVASPVWPATGIALAAAMLWGDRVVAVIFLSALAANLLGATSAAASVVIAAGTVLETLLMAHLLRRRCGGPKCFATAHATWRFLAISAFSGPVVSATLGAATVVLDGHGQWGAYPQVWATWWMANVSGAVLVTPVLLLWAARPTAWIRRAKAERTAAALLLAVVIGGATLSPLAGHTSFDAILPFLSILPLIWTAVRSSQRDTATVALVLCAFAIWGVSVGDGPFLGSTDNQTYLLLQSFIVSVTIPSLLLSAHLAEGRETADALRGRTAELEAVLATVPATVWVTRDAEGRIIEGNRYAAEMLRVDPSRNHSLTARGEERPTTFRIFKDGVEVPPEDLPVQRAARGVPTRNEVLELRFSDGTVRWEVVNAAPIPNGKARFRGAVGAAMDITLLKEGEQRQAMLLEELDHRAKNMLAAVQAIVRLSLG